VNNGLSSEEMTCLCKVLQENLSVQEVILFGSRAKGTFHPGSDVDLAVKGCSDSDVISLSAALNQETILPYFFDVVAYEKISSFDLLDHIERVGVTLYSREDKPVIVDTNRNLKIAIDAALRAGGAVLEIYKRDFEVKFKADESPLTEADQAAHHIIVDALEETGLPVLSEESRKVSYEERKGWTKYWLVDPLDGTKEFIQKNGEFTVNIALIGNGRPVMGVVYAPVLQTIYYGLKAEGMEQGAWKAVDCSEKSVDEILDSAILCPVSHAPYAAPLRVVASRSHCNEETQAFISELEAKYGAVERISKGSSLKLCRIAEGSAEIYPRIAPTMEWDTAAAQAIVEASGGQVIQYDPAVSAAFYWRGIAKIENGISPRTSNLLPPTETTFCPLCYNKENLLNPFFVAIKVEEIRSPHEHRC